MLIVVGGMHQHLGCWLLALQRTDDLRAGQPRKPKIQDNQIGVKVATYAQRLLAISRLPNDLDILRREQHEPQALAHHWMIIHDHHPNRLAGSRLGSWLPHEISPPATTSCSSATASRSLRHLITTTVSCPARLRTCTVAPTA